MLVTNSLDPDGSRATPLGYQAVGTRPATWSVPPPDASRTTAMSLSPALVTYRVEPSGLTVRAFGLAPIGASV